MTRIYGKPVDLDAEKVHAFFEKRGQSINTKHPVTSVLYQDHDPQLAERRDAYEKARILPLLGLHETASVLDIGCGIGRWADALVGKVRRYHGIDFSESLVDAARKRHSAPGFSFQVLAAQDARPSMLAMPGPFSHVLIAGVLIYLNDTDLLRSLASVAACCASTARVYVREPVARKERLTLNNFPSAELKSAYSAIYRTEAELLAAFQARLLPSGFRITLNDQLYHDDMNNRSETAQRVFVLQRP